MKTLKKIYSIFIIIVFVFSFAACTVSSSSSAEGDNTSESSSDKNLDGQLKVHFIDVGQADCILIQQGNENMLIDAGNNDDENTIKNYLKSINVNEFKYVIGTHPHEDHIGSMDYIVNSYKVEKIFFPKITTTTRTFENLVNAIRDKGMKFTVPKAGETFNLGKAQCTIVAPNGTSYEDLNNYSIVVKVEFGSNSFIFTGDAEDVSELEMLSKGYDLQADVLKVGHHGSSSSTTNGFLNAVNPKYAVISVGKGNDYGHPHKEILNKFSSKNIKVYRTDESGTIIASSNGTDIGFNTASSDSYTEELQSSTVQSKNAAVWVSKNGGKVYHFDKNCSGMKEPVQMTLEEAETKGLKQCTKCD